jgi:hypothetical protein
MRRRRPPPPPEAGIYELGARWEGQECWVAHDGEGNCCIERGDGAVGRLESWLDAHGVKVPASRPALFLM